MSVCGRFNFADTQLDDWDGWGADGGCGRWQLRVWTQTRIVYRVHLCMFRERGTSSNVDKQEGGWGGKEKEKKEIERS